MRNCKGRNALVLFPFRELVRASENIQSLWRSVTTNSQQTTYSITGGVAGLTCGTSLAATVVSTGTANVVDGEVNRRIQGKETKASDVALGTQGTKNPRTIFELNYKGDVKKVAVSVGNNGYIVGANMRSLE